MGIDGQNAMLPECAATDADLSEDMKSHWATGQAARLVRNNSSMLLIRRVPRGE